MNRLVITQFIPRDFEMRIKDYFIHVINAVTINQHVGYVRKKVKEAVLTDDKLVFMSEIGIKVPSIEANGECNLLFPASKQYPDISPNIYNSSVASHKAEMNLLSSIASGQLADTNKFLIDAVKERLGIEKGITRKNIVERFNEKGLNWCEQNDVVCEFRTPIGVHQECLMAGNVKLNSGHVFPYEVKPWDDNKELATELEDPEWKHGRCGALFQDEVNGKPVINVNPSVCCNPDLETDSNCPREAVQQLERYNKRAHDTGSPVLASDKTYCVEISGIWRTEKPKESEDKNVEKVEQSVEKEGTDAAERSVRSIIPDKWTQFGHYWGSGGPLTPFYASSLVKKNHEWTKMQLKDVRKAMIDRTDKVFNMGSVLSKSINELQKEICKSKYAEWGNIIRVTAATWANRILEEVKRNMDECAEDVIPYAMNYTSLHRICQSQTKVNRGKCDYIKSLFSCENKHIEEVAGVIRIKQQVTLELPTWADNLTATRIQIVPVPVDNLWALNGRLPINEEKVEKVENEMAQSSESKTIEQLLTELVRKLPKGESRRRRNSPWGMYGSMTDRKVELTDEQKEFKRAKKRLFEKRARQRMENHQHQYNLISKNRFSKRRTKPGHEVEEKVVNLPTYSIPQENVTQKLQVHVNPDQDQKEIATTTSDPNTTRVNTSKAEIRLNQDKNQMDAGTQEVNIGRSVTNLNPEHKRDIELPEVRINKNIPVIKRSMLGRRSKRSSGTGKTHYRYAQLDLPLTITSFQPVEKPELHVSFSQCKTRHGISICSLGINELWAQSLCIEAILNNRIEMIEATCPIKFLTGPECKVSRMADINIVSTYNEIEILTESEQDESAKHGIFAVENTQQQNCKGICVLPRNRTSKFRCNGFSHVIGRSTNVTIEAEVKVENGKNLDFTKMNMHKIDTSDLVAIPGGEQKVIVPQKWKNVTLVIGMIVLTIITIIVCVTLCIKTEQKIKAWIGKRRDTKQAKEEENKSMMDTSAVTQSKKENKRIVI